MVSLSARRVSARYCSYVDTYQLIAALVGALVWPLFLTMLLILLHKPITKAADALAGRMGQLKSVAGGGLDFQFMEHELEKSQSALEAITSGESGSTSMKQIPLVQAVAKASPNAAIIQTWIAVEAAINEVADLADLSPVLPSIEKVRRLQPPSQIRESIETLQMIKNSALRSPELLDDFELSARYIRTGEVVIAFLHNRLRGPSIGG